MKTAMVAFAAFGTLWVGFTSFRVWMSTPHWLSFFVVWPVDALLAAFVVYVIALNWSAT